MTEQRARTGAARYVGDIVAASTDCLREVGGCVEELLDRADGLQGSARRVVRSVVRPEPSRATVQEQIDELRAAVAELAAQTAGSKGTQAKHVTGTA
ncbi:MAG: hypothetical protein HOV83_11735 [Catenulispora sp.]|nr:hypothetical protein [Catenulispora sp.]